MVKPEAERTCLHRAPQLFHKKQAKSPLIIIKSYQHITWLTCPPLIFWLSSATRPPANPRGLALRGPGTDISATAMGPNPTWRLRPNIGATLKNLHQRPWAPVVVSVSLLLRPHVASPSALHWDQSCVPLQRVTRSCRVLTWPRDPADMPCLRQDTTGLFSPPAHWHIKPARRHITSIHYTELKGPDSKLIPTLIPGTEVTDCIDSPRTRESQAAAPSRTPNTYWGMHKIV